MAWYENSGPDGDIVLGTKVSLNRNTEQHLFPACLDAKGANELIESIGGLLENNGFRLLHFADISPANAVSYVESMEASASFVRLNTPHALAQNLPCNLSVMLCEEDHLVMQCLMPGLSFEGAYANVCKVEEIVDRAYPLAFDKRFGYLTQNPAMHGTGMRATAILSLPLLEAEHLLGDVSARIAPSLLLTPLYRTGSLYLLSNALTVGLTEEALLTHLRNTATELKGMENELLNRMIAESEGLEALSERVYRARSLLCGSYSLSETAFLRLSADLRLGIRAGIIKDIPFETVTALTIECMPAHLHLQAQDAPKDEKARNRLRAQTVTKALSVG